MKRKGWPVARAAETSVVFRRTAYRRLARFRSQARPGCGTGVRDRITPRTPFLPEDALARIKRLRRRRLTEQAIALTIGLARSTLGAVLRRIRLGKLAASGPMPPDHRVTGRGPSSHGGGGRGWDYLHVCVDDASRLALHKDLAKRDPP